MKKILLSVLFLAAVTAFAQTAPALPDKPVFRPFYDSQTVEEKTRFQFCENTGGTGFYWLDTTNGNLWRLNPATMEWNFLGAPRGANSTVKGTYELLSDRNGGVYVLNTDNGKGWWNDGAIWKVIGEPARRMEKTE